MSIRNTAFILILVAAALCTSCDQQSTESPSKSQSENIEWIDPSEIQWGPILHDSLSDDLVNRIKVMHVVFAEVYPIPLEEWIDGFRYDANPEREVAVWEAMARAYTAYTAERNLSLAKRNELFSILLVGSGAPIEDALNHLELKYFTRAEAREVLVMLYSSGLKNPSPIKATIQ